jgi:hypothetical protein
MRQPFDRTLTGGGRPEAFTAADVGRQAARGVLCHSRYRLAHHGQTVLISEETGQINWPSEKGLYFFDTRVVSSWTIYANGEPWELLNGAISYSSSRIFLTNRSLRTEDGTIPQRTLGLTISRWISGGMHEDLDIRNDSHKPVKFQLEIALRCDFADIFEGKSGSIVRRGRITTDWSEPQQPVRSSAKAVYANGRLSFEGGPRTGRVMALLPPLTSDRR